MTKSEFIKYLSGFDLTLKRIENILSAMEEDFSFDKLKSLSLTSIVGEDLSLKLKNCAFEDYFEDYLEKLESKNIKLITIEDEAYPEKLRRIDDAPIFLFCKGDLSLLKEKSIAIIGSRSPSNYGRIVTERFAGELAKNGVVVVSGLAYRVDGISHRKTLDEHGKTIAVLGGGFDKIYPAEHTNMANEIVINGLLVSEYRPEVSATKYTFPQRNRIVAGLSDGVLITEASAKSGTIITKDFAIDNGIVVYAVPGNITSDKSQVPNEIIATMQGTCVLSAEEILKDLGLDKKSNKRFIQLGSDEAIIVELLSSGEKDIEFLSENVDFDIKKLNSLLTTLEIKSIIKRMPGGFYSLG